MYALPKETEDRLEQIAGLPTDRDGNGTAEVKSTTVRRTRSVLGQVRSVGTDLNAPFISPTRDGRMILEWKNGAGGELIIDIPGSPERSVRFLLIETTPNGEETETEAEIGDTWSIQTVVQRLTGNSQTRAEGGQATEP